MTMAIQKKGKLRKAGEAIKGTAIVGLIGGGAGAAVGAIGGLPVNLVIDGLQEDDVVEGLGDTVKNTALATSVGTMVGANAGRMRGRNTTVSGLVGGALGAGAGLITSAVQALLTNRGTKQDAELIDAVAEEKGLSSEQMLAGLVAAGVLGEQLFNDAPDSVRTGYAGPERRYLRG